MIWFFYWLLSGLIGMICVAYYTKFMYSTQFLPITVKDALLYFAFSCLGIAWVLIFFSIVINDIFNSKIWRMILEYELVSKKKDNNGGI